MKVFMPDGTEYQTLTEGTTNVEMKPNGPTPHQVASTDGQLLSLAVKGTLARTLVVIATELDAAQKELATAELKVEISTAEVARLTKELRNFGVKKRAPRVKT